MRNFLLTTCAVAVFATGAAHANDELIRMSQNPKDWVMPTGDYADHRYSQDTRSLQHYLGHKNIQHTVRYSELSPDRFREFWKD
jgi:hypothetical protein